MSRFVTSLVLATAAAFAFGPTPADAAAPPTTYVIDPVGPAADGVFPEGVAKLDQFFYVGSTTDGTIYRGDLGGRTATPFLPGGADGRTFAVGLKAVNGLLFVAGGPTGRVFIYDIATRALVGSFQVPSPGAPTFVNDLVVARDGTVYITDSFRPLLYRIGAGDYATTSVETLPVFVDFTGTALPHQPGAFNVNGIVVSSNGRQIVVAHSTAAALFRVRVADRSVTQVDLGGAPVSGDGLLLRDHRIYAVEDQGDVGFVVKIRVSDDFRRGTVVRRVTHPSLDDPTTAAFARGRLLVVNSQFGERAAGVAPDPFTVSRIPIP
ncbi:MAG: SMP-30/gluconolactonase/LRE family protein [Actinomycetes bacterium]